MTDEHQPDFPRIRDPRTPVNLVEEFEPLDIPLKAERPNRAPRPSGGRAASSVSDQSDQSDLSSLAAVADAPRDTFGVMSGTAMPSGSAIAEDLDRSMGRLVDEDPLAGRPRASSRVLCVLFALLLAAAAAGVYWLGVRTEAGQSFDDMVEMSFSDVVPGWMSSTLGLGTHVTVVAGSALLAAAAAVVAAARRRWWLLGQLAVFAALIGALSFLKYVLPRPFIINTQVDAGNSAPSGHTLLAVAAALALICAVPRAWRWCAALLGLLWSAFVGLGVVNGRWHRPTDAVMAILLAGAAMMLALAFTRASGMDATGTRRSSAGVQIAASVGVTGGLMSVLYAAYLIWQVQPGLLMSAQWAATGTVIGAGVLISGTAMLVCALTLAMRQLTAAPLSRLGLVGAPPAPPAQRRGARG